MIDLPGLLVAAVLLTILVALEVRRAGQETVQETVPSVRTRLLSRRVSRIAVAAVWVIFLLLFVPRVWGLIT